MGWDHFTASDGFAIGMIVVIGTSFGVILSLFISMRRHASRRDHEVDELIQEINEREHAILTPNPQKPGADKPWERDGDWWKKS